MTSAVKVSAAGTRNLALCPNPKVGSADQCLPACGGLPLGVYMVSIQVRGLSRLDSRIVEYMNIFII